MAYGLTLSAYRPSLEGIGNGMRKICWRFSLKLQFYGTSVTVFGITTGAQYTVSVDGKATALSTENGVMSTVESLEHEFDTGLHSSILGQLPRQRRQLQPTSTLYVYNQCRPAPKALHHSFHRHCAHVPYGRSPRSWSEPTGLRCRLLRNISLCVSI
ncbi:hypothetical protein BKA62DRAFT_17410 [Auriculariales sp. MPI-PUGE-AT-0066]|nr:hypothetical protein BKA62DRAFT_17410 [Auriculariales sp. MPI-PUGE-AT-0066]